MAGKLRSISSRIHWSSLLRAAVFAAAWLLLPFWVFVLIALYLYFIPWFEPGKLAFPFLILLVLAFAQAAPSLADGLWFALIFGAIFYCILLVKDLLVLDRRSMYEVIILALAFFLLRDFYAKFSEGVGTGAPLFYAFLVGAAVALLLRNFLGAFPEEAPASRHLTRTASWLAFLLIAQLGIAGLFLPLDFIYQSVIVFLVTVLIIDLTAEHAFAGPSGLSRNKILGVASTVFVLLIIVIASAQWGL